MRSRKLVADLTRHWRTARQFTLQASAVCGFALVGCAEDVDSTAIRTAGIYADFRLVADGDGRSLLQMDLTVGGRRSNTHLRLKGRDRLVVDADGELRPVREREDPLLHDYPWYEASARSDNELFTVSFERGDDDENAPASTVLLPPPFEIEGLGKNPTASRSEGFTVRWEPADERDYRTSWSIAGGCVDSREGTASEDCVLEVAARELRVFGRDPERRCLATLTIERTRLGTIDKAFGEGGTFVAVQRRELQFESVP